MDIGLSGRNGDKFHSGSAGQENIHDLFLIG